MSIKFLTIAVSLLLPVAFANSTETVCHQCLETSTHADCADCASYVRQVMLKSDQSQLTKLMHTLRDRSKMQCQETALDSRACQIYLSLCDDGTQCEGELFQRVLDYRDRRFNPQRHVA